MDINAVITAIVIAVIFGLYRLLRYVPKRTETCFQTWDRARDDYRIAAERAHHDHRGKLRAIDDEFIARRIYNSGLRLAARSEAEKAFELRGEELQREKYRRMDDAFKELRRIDVVWLVLREKKYRTNRGLWVDLLYAAAAKRSSLERDFRHVRESSPLHIGQAEADAALPLAAVLVHWLKTGAVQSNP